MTRAQDFYELANFLDSSAVPAFSMNAHQLDGYLRAVSMAPSAIDELQWLPLIFNEQEPAYQSEEHKARILTLIRERYLAHTLAVEQEQCHLPCESVYARLQEDRSDLEQWARGALQGYIICEGEWNKALAQLEIGSIDHKTDEINIYDDFDAIIAIVSTVADAKYAVEMGAQLDSLPALFESFPNTIIRWGVMGRNLRIQTKHH